jgi:hypothetical protein
MITVVGNIIQRVYSGMDLSIFLIIDVSDGRKYTAFLMRKSKKTFEF